MDKKIFRPKINTYLANFLIYSLIGIFLIGGIGLLCINFYIEVSGPIDFSYFRLIEISIILYGLIYSLLKIERLIICDDSLICKSAFNKVVYKLEDYNIFYGRSRIDKNNCIFLQDKNNYNLFDTINLGYYSEESFEDVVKTIGENFIIDEYKEDFDLENKVELNYTDDFTLIIEERKLSRLKVMKYIKTLIIPLIFIVFSYFEIGNFQRDMIWLFMLITIFIGVGIRVLDKRENNIREIRLDEEELYIRDSKNEEYTYLWKDVYKIYMSGVEDGSSQFREIIIEYDSNCQVERDLFNFGETKDTNYKENYIALKDDLKKKIGNNLVYPYNERNDLR